MRLNGNLTLNAEGTSEAQNFIIERVSALPSILSSEKGRIVFLTTTSIFHYNTGSVWMPIATGGNASALQAEVDAIEATLGGLVATDGTFSAGAFSSFLNVTSPTSLLNALTQIDSAITGQNELAELQDVSLGTLANKQVLYWDGSIWVNHTLVLTDISDVTASATEVNYLVGVTSGVQSQFTSAASALTSEATTARAAELALTNDLATEVTRAETKEGQLQTDLTAEVSRASAAEGVLQSNIDAENIRAEDAENTLTTNLASEATTARAAELALTNNLAAEVTRATGAESTLTSNLAAEVTRATGAETALDGRLDVVEAAFINKDGSVAFTGDQSLGGFKLTNVAAPVAGTDATNKTYVDSKITALGNAFDYIGTVAGGVDALAAFDLAGVSTATDAGSYYKVSASGYFKVGAGAAFYANQGDGLVWNPSAGVDIIDNTNSQVAGTTDFITVTGSSDTGFTVDVATTFKNRSSTLESGLAAETSRATAAEAAIAADLVTETSRATAAEGVLTAAIATELTRATAAESALTTSIAAEATAARAAELILTNDLNGEITRATAAEGVLTSNLATEVSRAEGAEGTLTANLAAEVTRATAAEGVLTSNLAAELTRATGAEAAIAANLATEVSRAGVAEGVIVSSANAALAKLYFLYSGASATSHVVSHGIGQKYCNVTVVDTATDEVIIPQSIVFDSTTGLTVTLNAALAIKVIVMGYSSANAVVAAA